jgi:cytochrome c oxidase cbb3-type subunit III
MMVVRFRIIMCVLCAAALHGFVHAQNTPAPSPPTQAPAGRRGFGMSVLPRPRLDPAVVARGKDLYTVNCAFCHGSDARGGEGGGSNLLRSQLVLTDKSGENILPVVQNGQPGGMPKFNLSAAQVSDIAAFLHSFTASSREFIARPPNILVGDAAAGKVFFMAKCASCHSDGLKGIASRITDTKTLQQTWIMPGAGILGRRESPQTKPTVTVTLVSGRKVKGKLDRIDDFLVTLTDSDGNEMTFPRNGDQPRVEIHDPLQGHLDLLPLYTDQEIQDVTAYLWTLK